MSRKTPPCKVREPDRKRAASYGRCLTCAHKSVPAVASGVVPGDINSPDRGGAAAKSCCFFRNGGYIIFIGRHGVSTASMTKSVQSTEEANTPGMTVQIRCM